MRSSSILLVLPVLVAANERKFGYTYETSTMPVGQREIEVWNTVRGGGAAFTSSIDQRLEFEVGVTAATQASLYLNASSTSDRNGNSSSWKGFSIEVKHQMTDPAADAFGSAWYLETAVQTDEVELEGKLLLDKRVGPWTFAANGVAETEWVWDVPATKEAKVELEGVPLELDLAGAYSFTPRVSLGLEAHLTGEYQKTTENGTESWGLQGHAFHLGPTLSVGADSWWTAISAMPRVVGEDGESQEVEFRLLAGFHF